MSADQVATEPIELRFTLTADDFVDGLAVQIRGIRTRWTVVLMAGAVLVGLVIGLGPRAPELTSRSGAVVLTVVLIFSGVAIGLGVLLARVLRRPMRRWQAGLIMRGNPWLTQPITAIVSTAGLDVRNAAAHSVSNWSQYPLYAETDRSFVLLASKSRGAMSLVLPKRGLPDGDPAPLRALLDSCCRRRT